MPTLNQYNVNNSNGNLTYSIIENPLIEPLDGPLLIDHLLQRFPEAIYSRGRETHLYRFLTALAGDSGAGALKKQSLYLRMKSEANLLSFEDLDGAHTTFGFARLPNETYKINTKTSYLTPEEWNAIRAADMSYRKRIMDFYSSISYGNSPEGMRLASKAGSGQDTLVIENYKYIFDKISDEPTGVEYLGNTKSVQEFIVQPAIQENNNNTEHYAILTLNPPEGGFSDTDYFEFSYKEEKSNAKVYFNNLSPTILAAAIAGLSVVELGEVVVSQITSLGYKIIFTNPDLNIINLKVLSVSTTSGGSVEISYSFVDGAFYTSDFGPPNHEYYDDVLRGIASSKNRFDFNTNIWLDPAYERNMNDVVNRLKPTSSIFTFKSSVNRKINVQVNSVFATSEKFSVSRFIKGNPDQGYTIFDPISGKYITPNLESESRTLPLMGYDFPVISLTIENVTSYKDEAFIDKKYDTIDFYNQNNLNLYLSMSYANGFSAIEKRVFNIILGGIPKTAENATDILFSPDRALPDYPTQAVVTAPIVT